MTPVATEPCPTCKGQGSVYRAPIGANDLAIGHADFGRDYPCPRCRPAAYNVEREKRRWER